ncbi:MAG: fimbrial assembly protein [Bdellovibrionales bacterium RBG_16_40_8]|nr:MAG: fimbrial assembly protein [Bdellovibrionales bacterium RBG_16_40_8]
MISFFGKKKIIGLDIGSSSIKAAELDVGKKSSTLIAFGIVPTPPQSYVNGDIVDPQIISTAIRELLLKIKTKRKHAATGLGGTSVIVKRITIPRMDENLIADQIRWEAEQYIPYDINEVNLGYEVLKGASSNKENMDLLLVAAVQAHVIKYTEALALSGLNCAVLDVSGFALVNCFKTNYGDMSGQTVVLLNAGATATTMVGIENTEVVFLRDIPVGGLNYTLDLQKSLNISLEEAEAMKLGAASGRTVPEEAKSVIKATNDVICEELKSSFDFFLNSTKSQNITRCFVTGGGAKTYGFLDVVSKILPCEKLDPFLKVRASTKVFSQEYLNQIRDFAAVSIGLGLRDVSDA